MVIIPHLADAYTKKGRVVKPHALVK